MCDAHDFGDTMTPECKLYALHPDAYLYIPGRLIRESGDTLKDERFMGE